MNSEKENDKDKDKDSSKKDTKKAKKFRLAKNLSERLDDVKGIDEVRTEIEEIVMMLKNPSAYEDVGAKLIRGILLIGKPGTGKTLLARALAGESGVNFIYVNASEFDKSLVGAVHIWPELNRIPHAAAWAAASMSGASSKTMFADFPPSSNHTCFKFESAA